MAQLEDSRNELERYHVVLEEQVETRTRELAQANDEMKMEIAERMRAEEELRSSESMLKHAAEGVGEGIWMWDVASGEVDLSPLSMEILGCAADVAACPPEMRWMEGGNGSFTRMMWRRSGTRSESTRGDTQGYRSSTACRAATGLSGGFWSAPALFSGTTQKTAFG